MYMHIQDMQLSTIDLGTSMYMYIQDMQLSTIDFGTSMYMYIQSTSRPSLCENDLLKLSKIKWCKTVIYAVYSKRRLKVKPITLERIYILMQSNETFGKERLPVDGRPIRHLKSDVNPAEFACPLKW